MKIKGFEIINFKNISYARCDNLPDFVVLAGENGCGKSSILQALITAKEILSGYGQPFYNNNFQLMENIISANNNALVIRLKIKFSQEEFSVVKNIFPDANENTPILFEVAIHKSMPVVSFQHTLYIEDFFRSVSGNGKQSCFWAIGSELTTDSNKIYDLMQKIDVKYQEKSKFDYFSAHRQNHEQIINSWNPNYLNIDQKRQLLTDGKNKYQYIKQYLVEMKLRYSEIVVSELSKNKKIEELKKIKSDLDEIRNFFTRYFYPMKFEGVDLSKNPFEFTISTPNGNIDIDGLSSGEKEILSTFIHFYHLALEDSVILFDEPDTHLHPELARKYISLLKDIRKNNQFILSTHSPELMDEAGFDALFTIIKHPQKKGENQFIQVSNDDVKHDALYRVMGSKGFISFNKTIVFVEGKTDITIYKKFFPADVYNISFVEAGNCEMVKSTIGKVYDLMNNHNIYQSFWGIVDGDYNVILDKKVERQQSNLINLPVYHIENFLLDEEVIYIASKTLLEDKMPYSDSQEIKKILIELLKEDEHKNIFYRKIETYKDNLLTNIFKDEIRKNKYDINKVNMEEIKNKAKKEIEIDSSKILDEIVNKEEWKAKCIAKNLLSQYRNKLAKDSGTSINKEIFMNIFLGCFKKPPEKLLSVFDPIINTARTI